MVCEEYHIVIAQQIVCRLSALCCEKLFFGLSGWPVALYIRGGGKRVVKA